MVIRETVYHCIVSREAYFTNGKELIEKFANDRPFASATEFAKFLYEIEPARSLEAWRAAVNRWLKDGNTLRDIDSYIDNSTTTTRIYYDKANDKYIVMLESNDGMLVVDGEKHRAMKKAYSDVGGGLTYEEMSREFDMPGLWISEYIRVNGWKHAMQPFTDEEVFSNTLDDMVDNFLDLRKIEILKKAEKKKWRQIEKDAEQYSILRETLSNDFFEMMANHKPASVKRKPMKHKKKGT